MSRSFKVSLGLFLLSVLPVLGENQCYYAKDKVGPSNLVPCTTEENSPCCLLGDRCFSGGVCISAEDVIYQYGCTDSTFESEACPFKCGWDDSLSPWESLQYCNDIDETWICQGPESCGCEWEDNYNLTNAGTYEATRTCKGMGTSARVALYAPASLVPYVLLPTSKGGSTGYFTPAPASDGLTRWYTSKGYTPTNITAYVPTYTRASPTSVVLAEVTNTADATATKTGSSTSSATAGTASQTGTANSESSLSTGAKAGIGAGVGGAALAAAIIGFLLYRLHKQRKANQAAASQTQQVQPPQGPNAGYGYSPVPHGQSEWSCSFASPNSIPPGYTGGQSYPFPQELESKGPVLELPTSSQIHEMDSGAEGKK